MKVETENLKRLKSLAEKFQGEKGPGVSKQYIIELLKKHDVSAIEIDGTQFYDVTKLPKEIKSKLKF